MPIYEYECDACGNRFELIQKFSDPPVETCPKCGQPKVRKLLSSPAFQFKGSGWYITDYARKGTEGSDAAKSADASKPGDSKPAEKPAADKDKAAPAAAATPAAPSSSSDKSGS
jgi:putative FmdB family regulatory protein